MPKDKAWTVGFIIGAASTGYLLSFVGFGGILKLVLAVGVGVLAGWATDVAFGAGSAKK